MSTSQQTEAGRTVSELMTDEGVWSEEIGGAKAMVPVNRPGFEFAPCTWQQCVEQGGIMGLSEKQCEFLDGKLVKNPAGDTKFGDFCILPSIGSRFL